VLLSQANLEVHEAAARHEHQPEFPI